MALHFVVSRAQVPQSSSFKGLDNYLDLLALCVRMDDGLFNSGAPSISQNNVTILGQEEPNRWESGSVLLVSPSPLHEGHRMQSRFRVQDAIKV